MLLFNNEENYVKRQFFSLIKVNILCSNEDEFNFFTELFQKRKKLLDQLKQLNEELYLNKKMEYYF